MRAWTTLVCIATLMVSPALRGEHTRFWRLSQYDQWVRGTATNVSIWSDGRLVPAPAFRTYADPNLAYLWAIAHDARHRVYVAGGSPARVVRIDGPERMTTIFQSSELTAQALAFDAHDHLFVATSPDGKIYRVSPDGKSTVFFDPKAKYLWALAVARDGTLFVGTGDRGEVLAVTPDGKGGVFYRTAERNIRSLAFDAHGNLVLGTDPHGLVIRVEIRHKAGELPQAGASFVLYETGGREVTSLAFDASGNLLVASVGRKTAGPLPVFPQPSPGGPVAPPTATLTITASGATVTTPPSSATSPTPPMTMPLPVIGEGTIVYRLTAEGFPEPLWQSQQSIVYAIDAANGRPVLGTGNNGELIELEPNGVFAKLAETSSQQITAIDHAPDGRLLLCTANPGKVVTVGPELASAGEYVSEPFDAKIFSHWGRLDWWGENLDGQVAFYVRSGNTSEPEKNWSPWFGPYTRPGAEPVGAPPARFVQWKAVFHPRPQGPLPYLSWVSLAYLPENVAPVIDDIEIQDPGIRLRSVELGSSAEATPPVSLRLPRRPGSNPPPEIPATTAAPPTLPPQGFRQKGWQSVIWSAHDDNQDQLEYTLYYRGEKETQWKLLKAGLRVPYYSWDTTSMPDGAYYLKIVASDAPSNPPTLARQTERISARFVVDNSPPVITNLHADATGNPVHVEFTARDPSSPLARAEYSLDAGPWTLIFPVGNLSDAPEETYRLDLPGLPPGEHTLSVRVADQFENLAVAKTTFTVPATSPSAPARFQPHRP